MSKKPSWLEGLDDAFARLAALHPRKIDLSLGRMTRILTALGNPELNLPPVVHIAGTNGKGSTLAFLRSLMEVSGKRVHLYTSPHLVRFNERIVVGGEEISNTRMTAAVREVERANQNEPLTFFEAMTAAALLVFSQERAAADFCLLETGLGGRLDGTNVVPQPAATIISSIDYDHQAFLGDTLAHIAFEKAGIIKAGCPVFVAPQEAEVLKVIKKVAAEKASPLFYCGRDFSFEAQESEEKQFIYKEGAVAGAKTLPYPCLRGAHQLENASVALFAAHQLGLNLTTAQTSEALKSCRWSARLEKLNLDGVEVYLDGGHNKEAGKMLAQFMKKEKGTRPAVLICAMRATKSARDFLQPFAGVADQLYTLDLPDAAAVPGEGAKAYSAQELQAVAQEFHIKAEATTLESALEKLAHTNTPLPRPLVLIAGSLLLAGDVLKRTL